MKFECCIIFWIDQDPFGNIPFEYTILDVEEDVGDFSTLERKQLTDSILLNSYHNHLCSLTFSPEKSLISSRKRLKV